MKICIITLFFIILLSNAQTAKQYKNNKQDTRGRNPDAIRNNNKPKSTSTKEKLEGSKHDLTIAAMSFSKEELFDNSPHEVTNAYIRIYQAIGQVIRMSHQYNVVDLDNQRGISYVSHMLSHIAEQSNKELDMQIAGSIKSKIESQKQQTKTIQDLANEVSVYAEKAEKKIEEFEKQMKEIREIKSTPTFVYLLALMLQGVTGYFIYVIYKKNNQF